jgi:hypothetical protein
MTYLFDCYQNVLLILTEYHHHLPTSFLVKLYPLKYKQNQCLIKTNQQVTLKHIGAVGATNRFQVYKRSNDRLLTPPDF